VLRAMTEAIPSATGKRRAIRWSVMVRTRFCVRGLLRNRFPDPGRLPTPARCQANATRSAVSDRCRWRDRGRRRGS
jgi:hypothetical protein